MNRGRLKMNKREFAVGRRWWQHVSKPAGGYVLVREQAMLDAWQKLSDGSSSATFVCGSRASKPAHGAASSTQPSDVRLTDQPNSAS